MREIKFRAWDKDAKEMSYSSGLWQVIHGGAGDDIALGLSLHWSVKNSFRGWDRDRSFKTDYQNGIIIFMQYTGLKDKNGKEIYEGDLLRVKNLCKLQEVKYGEQVDNGEYEASAFGYAFDFNFRENEVEIIGNIYQNPELLTKDQ